MNLVDYVNSTRGLLDLAAPLGSLAEPEKDTLQDLGINTAEFGAVELNARHLLREWERDHGELGDLVAFDHFLRLIQTALISGMRFRSDQTIDESYPRGRESLNVEFQDLEADEDLSEWYVARRNQLGLLKAPT